MKDIPAEDNGHTLAWETLLERLRGQPAVGARPWTRDELYDDEDELEASSADDDAGKPAS
jgi:hypothetical protein